MSEPEKPERGPGRIPTDVVKVNHETGNVHVPGKGDLPLIGPTSGTAYEELKRKETENQAAMMRLKRAIFSEYQCTQCKRKMSGALTRVKWLTLDGVKAEALVCCDTRCDAPVVMIKDALGLTV
jgi:hypothetical protein